MTISKEIINHVKEMENNLKGYNQKIIDQKEQRINENMEKIFNQLKTRKGSKRNKSKPNISKQKI